MLAIQALVSQDENTTAFNPFIPEFLTLKAPITTIIVCLVICL